MVALPIVRPVSAATAGAEKCLARAERIRVALEELAAESLNMMAAIDGQQTDLVVMNIEALTRMLRGIQASQEGQHDDQA